MGTLVRNCCFSRRIKSCRPVINRQMKVKDWNYVDDTHRYVTSGSAVAH